MVLSATPLRVTLFFVLVVAPLNSRAAEDPKDGRQTIQKMEVQAPVMTEEDQRGYNMPDRYQCDACKAVVYHLNATLVRKQPKSRRLKEWEYTEIFEEVCTAEEFKGYGIKLMGGENVLSGPSTKQRDEEFLAPGGASIQMGGETWEKRLGEICRRFVFDKVGDEELYELFRKEGELSEAVCSSKTRDCSVGPKAPPKKKSEKKEIKEEVSPNKKEEKKNLKKEEKKTLKRLPAKEAKPAPESPSVGEKKAAPPSGSKQEEISVTTFLAELAEQHGLAKQKYTKNRSAQDWERTMVALAGRLFEKRSSAGESKGLQEEQTIEI